MDANNVNTEEEDENRTSISQFQEGSAVLQLAPELVIRILVEVGRAEIGDLAKVAGTCRLLGWYVYQDPDKALWRDLHNYYFDDPRKGLHYDPASPEYEWRESVVQRWNAMRLMEKDVFEEVLDAKMGSLNSATSQIATTLLSMYNELGPVGGPIKSLNAPLLQNMVGGRPFDKLFHSSFDAARSAPRGTLRPRHRGRREFDESPDTRLPIPKLAELHVLQPWFSAQKEQLNAQRGAGARLAHFKDLAAFKRIVYNAQMYSEANDFGPFNDDGTVNWPVVDAIAQTMDANITFVTGKSPFRGKPSMRYANRDWAHADPPADKGIESCRGLGFKDVPMEELADWAKVEGPWRGSYAFMDYTDWMEFNFNSPPIFRHRAEPIEMESYIEAVGDYMSMDLSTEISDETKAMPELKFNTPISDKLPPIIFEGKSNNRTGRGGSHFGSHLRGRVALTTDDPPQVRWTWVVRYDGADRWRIEAVQVGGRGSKRGLVGVWSDVERGELSPIGPIYYWPITQEEVREEETRLDEPVAQPMITLVALLGAGMWEEDETDEAFQTDSEMLSEETDGGLEPEGDEQVSFP